MICHFIEFAELNPIVAIKAFGWNQTQASMLLSMSKESLFYYQKGREPKSQTLQFTFERCKYLIVEKGIRPKHPELLPESLQKLIPQRVG